MKGYKIILIANTALACANGGYLIHGAYRDHRAHEARIQVIVDKFKACPDLFKMRGSCLTNNEKKRVQNEAEKALRGGEEAEKKKDYLLSTQEYAKAGIMYVELGMENDARKIAGKCAQMPDERCDKPILEELSNRNEALERIKKEEKGKTQR